MVEHIMTRLNMNAEAMQFEGNQRNFNEIQSWVNNHNPTYTLNWNGWDRVVSLVDKFEYSKAEPGLLTINPGPELAEMECRPGDWLIKSSRDTFYTMQEKEFDEIWVVLH